MVIDFQSLPSLPALFPLDVPIDWVMKAGKFAKEAQQGDLDHERQFYELLRQLKGEWAQKSLQAQDSNSVSSLEKRLQESATLPEGWQSEHLLFTNLPAALSAFLISLESLWQPTSERPLRSIRHGSRTTSELLTRFIHPPVLWNEFEDQESLNDYFASARADFVFLEAMTTDSRSEQFQFDSFLRAWSARTRHTTLAVDASALGPKFPLVELLESLRDSPPVMLAVFHSGLEFFQLGMNVADFASVSIYYLEGADLPSQYCRLLRSVRQSTGSELSATAAALLSANFVLSTEKAILHHEQIASNNSRLADSLEVAEGGIFSQVRRSTNWVDLFFDGHLQQLIGDVIRREIEQMGLVFGEGCQFAGLGNNFEILEGTDQTCLRISLGSVVGPSALEMGRLLNRIGGCKSRAELEKLFGIQAPSTVESPDNREVLSRGEVTDLPPSVQEMYQSLPHTLKLERRRELNSGLAPSGDRTFSFQGDDYLVPDGVFAPSGTSRLIFSLIQDEVFSFQEKTVVVVGIGAGIEAILLARQGVSRLFCLDIHAPSAAASRQNFLSHCKQQSVEASFLASDLMAELPNGVKADFVLFNAPLADPESDDEGLARVAGSGSQLLARFLEQLDRKDVLNERGMVIMPISNTAHMRECLGLAIRNGYLPEILVQHQWDRPCEDLTTYVFGFKKDEVVDPEGEARELLSLARTLPIPDPELMEWSERVRCFAQQESDGLNVAAPLHQAMLQLRTIWIRHCDSIANQFFKSPPYYTDIRLPSGSKVNCCYERQLAAKKFESNESYRPAPSGWAVRHVFFRNGMGAISSLLTVLRDMWRPGPKKPLRFSTWISYFETIFLLRTLGHDPFQWSRLDRIQADALRGCDFLFLESVRYDWELETFDLEQMISAWGDGEDCPKGVLIDTTLTGDRFPMDRLLDGIGTQGLQFVAQLSSGLKLDQEGMELANVGILSIYSKIPGVASNVAELCRKARNVTGTGLSLVELFQLDTPFFLNLQSMRRHSKRVFDNNARLAQELSRHTGGIFPGVVHPVLSGAGSLDWSCCPFVVIHLSEDTLDNHRLLLGVLVVETRKRGLVFELGSSFGFRSHRFEVVVPVVSEQRGLFKVALGSTGGENLEGVLELLKELAQVESFDDLARKYPDTAPVSLPCDFRSEPSVQTRAALLPRTCSPYGESSVARECDRLEILAENLGPLPDIGNWTESLTKLRQADWLESLEGEQRLDELAKNLRTLWMNNASGSAESIMKSPPHVQALFAPSGAPVSYIYERAYAAHFLEDRIGKFYRPPVPAWSQKNVIFRSGMGAISTLLQVIEDTWRTQPDCPLRVAFWGSYFETDFLLRIRGQGAFQWARPASQRDLHKHIAESAVQIVFLETVAYEWDLEVFDLEPFLAAWRNRKPGEMALLVDSTLTGGRFPMDRLLRELAQTEHPPSFIAHLASGLKLDQEGLELANVGILTVYSQSSETSQKITELVRKVRTVVGTSLSFAESCALDTSFFLNRETLRDHSDRVFENNARLAHAIRPEQGGIFSRVAHPVFSSLRHLPWACSPFVVLHLEEENVAQHQSLLRIFAHEAKQAGVPFTLGSSFGFRHHRYEFVIPSIKESRPLFKIAMGSNFGPARDAIADIVNKIAAYPSWSSLSETYAHLPIHPSECRAWKPD